MAALHIMHFLHVKHSGIGNSMKPTCRSFSMFNDNYVCAITNLKKIMEDCMLFPIQKYFPCWNKRHAGSGAYKVFLN